MTVYEKPNMIKIIEESLGLSEDEARAFVGLYARGYITPNRISSIANLTLPEAENALKRFVEKGIAVEISEPIKGIPRYMPVVPWSAFTSYLDTFQNTIATYRKDLDTNIKGHIETLKKEVLQLKGDVAKAVNEQIGKFNEETIKTNDDISKTIASHITALQEEVAKKKEEITASYQQKIKAHHDSVEKYENTLSNTLDTIFDILTEKVKAIHEDAAAKHAEALNALNSNIDGVLDNFTQQILDKTSEENKAALNKLNSRINNIFDEYVSGVKVTANDFQESSYTDYDNWLSDLEAKLKDTCVTEIDGVKEKDSELREEIRDSQEKNFDWFKDRAAVMRKRAADTFGNEIISQEDSFSQFKDNITGITGDLIDRFRDMLDRIRSDFSSKVISQVEQLKGASELEKILTNNLDERLNNMKSEISSMESAFNSGIDEKISELKNSINGIQKDSTSEASKLIDELKNQIKDTVKERSKNLVQNLRDAISEIEEWEKGYVNAGQKWIKAITDSANQFKSSLGEDAVSLKEEISSKVSEIKDFKDSLKLKEITKTRKDKINEIESDLDNEMKGYQKSITESLETWFKTLKDTLAGVISDCNNDIDSKNQSLKDSLKSSLDSNVDWFKNNAAAFGEGTANTIIERIESIETDFYQLKDNIKDGTESLVQKFKDILDEVRERFLEKIVEQVERLRGDTANLEKTLSETLDERIDAYRNEIDTMRDEFYKGLDTRVANLENQSHAIRESSVSILSELIQSHKDKIEENKKVKFSSLDEITSKMKQDKENTIQEDIDRVEKVRTEGHTAEEQMKKEIKEFVTSDNERVDTMAKDVQAKVSETVSNTFTGVKNDVNKLDNEYLDEIDQLTKATGEENNEIITRHANEFQASATTMEKTLLELDTNHQNEYELNANTLNDKLAAKLEEEDSTITNRLVTSNDTAATTFREAEDRALESSKLLRAVWSETANIISKESELTWVLVTEEAIKEYMSDMIARTKSTITVVAPDFRDLPITAIKAIRRALRVKTASRILADARTEVAALLNQGNVEIRQRPEMDLYAAARDAEEVLIAPYTPGNPKTQVAIISQQPQIVNIIHEIIGPLIMARAQKISRV
ncbi:MAG: hypothetical protein ACTSO9_01795 [Candidatus Helarchaeota archaeon]